MERINLVNLAKKIQGLRKTLATKVRADHLLNDEQLQAVQDTQWDEHWMLETIENLYQHADVLKNKIDCLSKVGALKNGQTTMNNRIKIKALPRDPEHLKQAQSEFARLLAMHPKRTVNIYRPAGISRQQFYQMKKRGVATPQFAARLEKCEGFESFKKENMRPDVAPELWDKLLVEVE